jgi:peptidyl-prolyl cis-trans isomerase SurA
MFLPRPAVRLGGYQGVWMKRLLATCLGVAAATAGFAAVPAIGQQAQQPALASPARGQVVDGVVATVNDQVISQSDVRNRMRMILLSFPGQPDEQVLREAQQRAIDTLIEEKVQLQEFYKLVKDEKVSPEEIDEQIARLAQQNRMTAEQFTSNLAQAGISVQSLREQTEADIAWSSLIRGRYGRQVRVSELRVDEMLDRIKASLDKPQYNLAEIFLFAPDAASRTNAMATAETLIQQINGGGDFSAIAQQFSAAPSASTGGELGWMSQGDMRPEIEAAAMKAATVPALLPPIESEGGVYVVALLGKRDPSTPGAASLDLKQVIARGEGAAEKLQQVRAKAKTCGEVAAAVEGVEGIPTPADMNDVSLQQVQENYRAALEPLQAGQSTEPVDIPDGTGKMVFYMCDRTSGDPAVPSRDEIRDRLFNAELALVAERYLRDLKREASIDRR